MSAFSPLPTPSPAPVPLTHGQVRERLGDAALWDGLGFLEADRAELTEWITRLDPATIDRLAEATGPVLGLLGGLGPRPKDFFDGLPDEPGRPRGLVPMLALGLTAPEVVAYGRQLGLSEEVAAGGVRDLGQQVHVHRLVTGEFGLHTQWWLTVAWSGSFWWLGRLQFNLVEYAGRLRLSAHIPQTGPLTGVEESFARARRLAAHLTGLGDTSGPDGRPAAATLEIAGFHCDSWLLDPQLSHALAGRGNIAEFQRLWSLQDDARLADGDAIFFTFRTRERIEGERLARLPQNTSLERAVVARLAAGGHWYSRVGLRPLG